MNYGLCVEISCIQSFLARIHLSETRLLHQMTKRSSISAILALLIVGAVFPTDAAAVRRTTRHVRSTRHHRFRHIFWNPVLRGSRESMIRQNEEIDRLQLPRITDEAELEERIQNDELVPIEDTAGLRVAPNLKPYNRYCKSWTREFLLDLADAFHKEFGQAVQVNSAIRTMADQKKLRRHNRNAAPIDGETASSHMAGLTVDIAKRGLTKKQHKWIEEYFKGLRDEGLIEVAEERRQACFHVMVSERYSDWREQQKQRTVDALNTVATPKAADALKTVEGSKVTDPQKAVPATREGIDVTNNGDELKR